ncbi:MAG: sensor histidine kinase [Dictyoglomus sp.]|jgi:signal transduction histidine kinase
MKEKESLSKFLIKAQEDAINLINKTIEEVRDISLNLRPSLLDNLGLLSALKWYIQKQTERANINIEYKFNFNEEKLEKDYAISVFRIIQEGITNAIRHANAKNIYVEIKEENKIVEITIKDDGIGLNVDEIWKVKERAELLGGKIALNSEIGKGTEIKVCFTID